MEKKLARLFLNILLITTLLLQISTPLITFAAEDPFALTPEKRGIFEGLPDKFKGMFDSSTQRLNGFFQYIDQIFGGASQGSPIEDTEPEPLPQLPVSGDLLQIDGSWSANCQPDIPPDELHEATTDRAEYCDWNLPSTPDEANLYYSDPSACDGNWHTVPVTCLTDYDGNYGYNEGGESGCVGGSNLSTCLIKVAENTYHLHWKLELSWDDYLGFHQQGEQLSDFLFGDGVLRETLLFGTHQETSNWLYDGYFWPNPNRAMWGEDCLFYAGCSWGTDGTITCMEDNENFTNLFPYEFTVPNGTALSNEAGIGFQVKPTGAGCCGHEGGCYWDDYFGSGDTLSEYTAFSTIALANAIDQSAQCNQVLCQVSADCITSGGTVEPGLSCLDPALVCCNPPDPTGDPDIPCDYYPPIETFENCEAEYYPITAEEWEDSIGICYFLPDPLEDCVADATPDNTFDQCPLDANVNPLDLCWGLHDPTPGQYDPSDLEGPWSSQEPFDYTCRNQVPSANIVKYVGEQCNVTENLPAQMRSCTPTYARTSDAVNTYYQSYIRKLNGCNEYFEGSILPELGSTPGLPASNPPDYHEGFCQTATENNLLCSASDGQRCVNADSKPNVCRKAIKVETFETVHRTNTPPPSNAFTTNCLIRETTGTQLTCGHGHNCDEEGETCDVLPEKDDDENNICPPDDSPPEYTCNENDCCVECRETSSYGCNTISGNPDLCYYPSETGCALGSNYSDPYCSEPSDPDTFNCGEANDCYKEKSHCTFPMPSNGDPDEVDGPNNPARNCAVYEWTERKNIYTVVYTSNAINYSLHVENFSDHELEDIEITVDIPNFLDLRSTTVSLDSNNYTVSGTRLNDSGTNICEGQTNTTCNGHGGSVTWTIDTIPAYGEDDGEGNNYSFTIRLNLVPADIDSSGHSHYADHEIDSTSEIDYYTNNLISDDRLANLEFQANWQYSKVVELDAFWIGQGVFSNAAPTCSGDICFVDPDFRPFGWPVFGEINQDWGGLSDGNPLADELGDRYGSDEGLYKDCTDTSPQEWKHTGIDIIPAGGIASPTEVYTTHAGQVAFVGQNSNYPDRGYYVEIHSTSDDDCQPNYVTRYNNLLPGSLRLVTGDYVPRHKLLGIMGYSGQGPGGTDNSGYTHLTYQIRYGHYDQNWPDIMDNNVPGGIDSLPSSTDIGNPGIITGIYPLDMDPPPAFTDGIRAPFLSYQEPDDVAYPEQDSCFDNPYICDTDDLINNPDLTSIYPQLLVLEQKYETCPLDGPNEEHPLYFFCNLRTTEDDVRRCFYANP